VDYEKLANPELFNRELLKFLKSEAKPATQARK